VTSVTTSGPFTAALPDGTSGPVPLRAGDSLTVNVTFGPTVANTQSANLVVDTTENDDNPAGDASFSLVGYGTQPGVSVSPDAVTFGTVRVGAIDTLGMTVVNTSGAPLSFETTSTVAAPFSSSALPSGPTTLPAGATLAIPLTYTPTAASAGDTASLTFTVTSPSPLPPISVPITAKAVVGAPELKLGPKSLFFGLVPRGTSVTETFTIRNIGNTPLTLQKAAPPSGAFTTSTPVSEGTQILPHSGVIQTITFTPTTKGLSTAVYLITGNDGKGHQMEKFSGYDDVIHDWYVHHTGANKLLGQQIGKDVAIGDGYRCTYLGGKLYWSAKTGVHAVHGRVLARFIAIGGPVGPAGFPISNVVPLAHGARSRFANGWSIYWSRPTGAWAVSGRVLKRWTALGAQRGRLGYPVSDTHPIAGGFRGAFSDGIITWTRRAGYTVTYGPHRPKTR
jgi:hypothetical protein